MLTFDRLKLVTSLQYATNLSQSYFLKIPRKQGGFYYKYQQEKPFLLNMVACPERQEMTIEFTGKILQDAYPDLINLNNIRDCLEKIVEMNLCDLNIEAVIQNSKVCICDVTKDINCKLPMKDIKTHIKASITNYDKWLVKKCQNGGIEICNSVTDKKRYKRFVMYDKHAELQRAENREFLNSISDPERLLQYYDGKVRFELNLRSMLMVRQILNIPDNTLINVLTSTANPILDVFDLAIKENDMTTSTIYNKADKMAFLQKCNYDLQAVEMRIRASKPKTSSISRKMEPYRKLLQDIREANKPMNIRNLIA